MKQLVLVILSFCCVTVWAQGIDELKTQLDQASDANKAGIANTIAEKLTADKNYAEAQDYADRAIQLAESSSNENEQLRGLVNGGNATKKAKKFADAVDYFKKATAITEKQKMNDLTGYCYESIGFSYANVKKYKESNEAYRSALASNNYAQVERAKIIAKMAFNYYSMGSLKKAIEEYEKANKIYESNPSPSDQATLLLNLGGVYSNYGDYETALKRLKQAEELAVTNNLSSIGSIRSTIKQVESGNESKHNAITEFDEDRIKETENYIQDMRSANLKSIEEIEHLSVENQVKELKLLNQQKELMLKEQEAAAQQQELERIELETARKDAELRQSEAEQARTQAWLVGAGVACMLVLILVFVFVSNNKKLKHKNIRIAEQNAELDKKNQNITDSINYARKIQDALLVSNYMLADTFQEHFVFNKPRDIVSGDFSWCHNNGTDCVIILADCTGHGVPGALMSVLAISTVEKIVKQEKLREPEKILGRLNEDLYELFGSDKSDDSVKDGMDVVVINVNREKKELRFAGSRNSMLRVSGNKMDEIRGSAMHLGYHQNHTDFNQTTLQLDSGEMIYLYSDGFYDQKGGSEGKKFYPKRFRELLKDLAAKKANLQAAELEKTLTRWKGDREQIDDILILGIRI